MQSHNRVSSTVNNEKERGMCGRIIQSNLNLDGIIQADYNIVASESEQQKVNTLEYIVYKRYIRSITIRIYFQCIRQSNGCYTPAAYTLFHFIWIKKRYKHLPLGSMNRLASYGPCLHSHFGNEKISRASIWDSIENTTYYSG